MQVYLSIQKRQVHVAFNKPLMSVKTENEIIQFFLISGGNMIMIQVFPTLIHCIHWIERKINNVSQTPAESSFRWESRIIY